jgi:VWFA-related protein
MTLARFAALLALLAAAAAASADTKQQPPLIYSTDVSLVVLPVFVADGNGQAVRGLQPQDFAVEADGKPVEVVSFRYVDTTSAEDQEEIREAPAARRRFVFLFDLSFTDPSGLNRAQRAALSFFRGGMAASDLAAVITVDANRGMKLVSNFSDDRILLAHAVQTLGIRGVARISDPLSLAADLAATDVAQLGGRSDGGGTETAATEQLRILMRQLRQA